MIPILYSKSETQFLSNGLGRLTECISCDVTEERNGIYECEFTYPVTGRFCKEMMENGGIISVTHDNHGDRQAFDIYKFSAPIDGIVTFNAHHISYRLNGIIVTPFEASTCAGALQKISQKSANTNPFTFTTDKVVTAPYIVSVPSNARSLLGGSSGSILDTYGTGEYEWDMFNVNLHLHRGQNSGVTIRYGKNLTDIVNILDKSEIYNAIAPYWTDGEHTVTLPEVYMAVAGATDIICVPVDLTADFEEKPSVSDLRDDADRYLSNINPTLAHSNITIDFEALWQTTEYEDVAVLQQIGLCDTVSIYFPAIGVTQASAKAIKVVYDSLRDKYKSIEFGDAQTTLAESILGKGSSSFGDLSDGKIIGASIITAALIKAAKETIGQLTLTDTLGGPYISFDIDGYGSEGVISNNGFWFSRGPYKETIGGLLTLLVEQRTLEGHPDWLGIKFSPEKDGVSAGMATIAGFETVKDHFSDDWISYEEAYGRIIISRVKCDEDNDYAPVQVDKVIIDSENGAKMELYGSEINADVLTKIIPRKWQQFFSGSSVAVEIGNSGTKSYMILKNSSGTACVTLDTSTGAAFAIPVTATAGLTVSGGLSTDTLTSSGDASVGGNLSVTGSVTASGGVSVSGGLTTDTSSVSGNASVGGNMTVTGDVSADDVTVGGTLGVTGATTLSGNATVNGVLDVTKRRCEATLSGAGWYRAIVYNAYDTFSAQGTSGEIVTIRIVYTSSVSVQHEISLWMSYGKVAFLNETSRGTTNLVDKIRYTYAGSVGYVDIHITSSSSVTYNVSFEVASRIYAKGGWVAGTLTSVAPSPTGETVLTEYTFSANGTGGLTVNGVLDVTPRRCYASLSSEGWYRVCAISFNTYGEAIGAAGGILRLAITDSYASYPNDAHTIDLLLAHNKVTFVNEASAANGYLEIDKIRYTFTGTSPYNGYVDIHFLGRGGTTFIGISFDYTGIALIRQARVVAQNLQSVAASPSGETTMASYAFVATSGERNTFTPSHGTSAFGGCWYSRSGEYVTVHVGLTGITANTNHIIGTLPAGYRPVSQCCSAGSSETYGQEAHLYIRENGNIDVWSPNTMASLDATFMWR